MHANICPSCGRPFSLDTVECPYCGETALGRNFFASIPPIAFYLALAILFAAIFISPGIRAAYLDAPKVSTLSYVILSMAVLLVFLPNQTKTPGIPRHTTTLNIVVGIAWRCLFCTEMLLGCRFAVNVLLPPVARVAGGMFALLCFLFASFRDLKFPAFTATFLIILSVAITEYW